jgi:hypothetical protein
MHTYLKSELQELKDITKRLKAKYNRGFTLDGKLIGDFGEVAVALKYNLTLLPECKNTYDAVTQDGKHIQIKCSLKGDNLGYPTDEDPDYYIGVVLHLDGEEFIEEIYNGPGKLIRDNLLLNRKKPKNQSFYSVTVKQLRRLNNKIEKENRINV